MGRSRGGLTTKIHALVDGKGLPFRFALTPGHAHDSEGAATLLHGLKPGGVVLADKAYDTDWIRDHIAAQGAAPNIPDRCNRKDRHCFSRALYASATASSASSINSSTSEGSPRATRNSRQTISR